MVVGQCGEPVAGSSGSSGSLLSSGLLFSGHSEICLDKLPSAHTSGCLPFPGVVTYAPGMQALRVDLSWGLTTLSLA